MNINSRYKSAFIKTTLSQVVRCCAGGFMALLALACLSGCGSQASDLKQYIEKIKSRPAKPIKPIPEFVPPEKFTYPEDEERRSPFKPIKLAKQKDIYAPDTKRKKQPLEAFPLDSLKFVGTIEVGRVRWALISQPSGLVSRVKAGDYMGKNYGQIQKITKDTIQLEETVKVGGNWEKRAVKLELRTPK